VGEVLGMIESALRFLASVDVTQLPGETLAEVLTSMERMDSAQAAVRGRTVAVFNDKHVQHEYAYRAVPGWLVGYTRVRRGKAVQVRRLGSLHLGHPVLTAALAEMGAVTESIATRIAQWTGKLPADCVQAADEILVQACRAGAGERLLADLAAQIRVRVCGPDPEEDAGKLLDRSLGLEMTLGGAGVLHGGLTPECAAVLQAVLDAFGHKQGPGDDRSHPERMHDALQKACESILGTDRVPGKHGKPYTALVHVPFEHLLDLPGASVLVDAYTGYLSVAWQDQAAEDGGWADRVSGWQDDARPEWAGHRAADTVHGGDRGTWLDADRALRILPDAMIIPVVTGDIDPGAVEDLIALCVRYHQLRTQPAPEPVPVPTAPVPAGLTGTTARHAEDAAAVADALAEMEQQILGKILQVVSGPGGAASFLRRHLLGKPLAGPSHPMDVGQTDDIPLHLRRLVALRDQHCQYPGGCDQPAASCEPHHVTHRADGGRTSLTNLKDYCWWHHHVVLHELGWTLTVHPDGTSQVTSPDGKTIHSHAPPPRPG
jgi:hypothetical protein